MINQTQTRRLYRSRSNVVLAGVAAGIAEYFAIDPTIVRVVFVLVGLINPAALIAYLILALIIPVAPDETAI
jgi:phage shock protein C